MASEFMENPHIDTRRNEFRIINLILVSIISISILFIGWKIYLHQEARDTFFKKQGWYLWIELTINVIPRLCFVLILALTLVVVIRWFRIMLEQHQEAIEAGISNLFRVTKGSLKNTFVLGVIFGVFSMLGTQMGDVIDQKTWGLYPHKLYQWINFVDLEKQDCEKLGRQSVCKLTDYANVGFRDTWSIVAGIVGGPGVGLIAGLMGGAYRNYSFGGSLGSISFIATICVGCFAGIVRQFKPNLIQNVWTFSLLAISCTLLQRVILLLEKGLKEDWELGCELVLMIGIPVMLINSIGSFGFLLILRFLEQDRLENELKQKQLKTENDKLQMEKFEFQARRAKLVPHFYGNVLHNINSLCLVKNDYASASRYIIKLGDFNREMFKNSDKEFISLAHEIDQIERYLVLQKLRFEEKLISKIQIDSDHLGYQLPPMCLVTLVENSFEHGFKSPPYEITIQAKETDNGLEIDVTDNGKGMSAERRDEIIKNPVKSASEHGSGNGLFLLKNILQSAFENKASLAVQSKIGSGTTFTLTLPKRS